MQTRCRAIYRAGLWYMAFQDEFSQNFVIILNKMVKVLERINKLEKELKVLKTIISPKIDFSIDEKIWEKVKKELKKSRTKIYKKYYGKR
jgi:hypothetical protein